MTIVVNEKTRQLFPPGVRRQAGIKIGDELEVRVAGAIITMLPKLPTADDEYTPKQRRVIDARLAKADADIKAGRLCGPFDTMEELERSLRDTGKQLRGRTKTRRSSRR
jgi:bifunctional DNA-binding transcriptional regulator/antitoxin component of YhaV-PrlF toxin-antitoxin module